MGKVLSTLTKPIKDYNLESRAHRIISKEKPTPAPMYKVDADQYEKILKEYPDVMKEIKTKHEALDQHLKNVFVVSHDVEVKEQTNPDRPLPADRKIVNDFEYGFKEPDKVPPGRTTLKSALKFISDHQSNPKLYTANKISDDYLISEETVSNILKYYKVFEMYLPEQRKVKATFYGPKVQRHTLQIKKQPQLTEGVKKDKDS